MAGQFYTEDDLRHAERRGFAQGYSAAVKEMQRYEDRMLQGIDEQVLANIPPDGTRLPLDASLVMLNIGPIILQILNRHNLHTISDVIQEGEAGLNKINQLGRKRLLELKLALRQAGHQLK